MEGASSSEVRREDQIDRDHSSPNLRDSSEAPSPTLEDEPLLIEWSTEDEDCLVREIDRLTQCALICRVIGARPSRGELRDLLQSRLQENLDQITNIQFLGRGFYQLEFSSAESIHRMLNLNPLDLKEARALFTPWKYGFDVQDESTTGGKLYTINVSFPNLPTELYPLEKRIASQIGTVLEQRHSMAARTRKADKPYAVKLLVTEKAKLPKTVKVPFPDGRLLTQRVEYVGLPNQCFYCKQIGHLAASCQKRKEKRNQVLNEQRNNDIENISMHPPHQQQGVWKPINKVQETTYQIPVNNRFSVLDPEEEMLSSEAQQEGVKAPTEIGEAPTQTEDLHIPKPVSGESNSLDVATQDTRGLENTENESTVIKEWPHTQQRKIITFSRNELMALSREKSGSPDSQFPINIFRGSYRRPSVRALKIRARTKYQNAPLKMQNSRGDLHSILGDLVDMTRCNRQEEIFQAENRLEFI